MSEGWDWVFPRKAKFGRKTSSPRLSSYLTGEGEVASHGVPEKFSGFPGPGLICSKWAKKEATFGEPDVPPLAPWHAERRARQAQAVYRWASASDQGLACAERVRVPLEAGAPACTASGWAGAARIWRGHTFWALGWGRSQPCFRHTLLSLHPLITADSPFSLLHPSRVLDWKSPTSSLL